MKKEVYFVRHGQSVGNVDGIYHGTEVRLTDHGERQARLVAKRCAALDFELIVSSTMERARATAGFIQELTGKPIEYLDDLVERIEPSEIRGKHGKDPEVDLISRKWTETYFTRGERISDGENFDDSLARVKRSLEYFERRPERSFVAVTHGFQLRMVIAYVTFGEALTPELFKGFLLAFRTTNTGVTFLSSVTPDIWHPWMGDRKWIIRSWNDYAHLGEHHSSE